ncbi:hypothetical protein CAEBREN_01671 [Caenorhabditis brenneri]|uniref:Uncharacterized protein n=1 Tax=Caenorhabditis brenneri TaxID=135651 RepID=G0NWA6_CAEBE|nr:hypothetical protein CAEBREN_01671 [Caenorhabditis brenneri]
MARIPDGPVTPIQMNNGQWYNPFLGDFDLEKCALGNTTWLHNEKLITSRDAIEYELRKYEVKIAMKKIELYSGLYDLIQNTQFRRFFQVSIDSFFS